MKPKWQDPGDYLDSEYFRLIYPDCIASYLWTGPDSVELRVCKKVIHSVNENGKKVLGRVFLSKEEGQWVFVEEMCVSPVADVVTAAHAEIIGVPALVDKIHVRDHAYDRCLRCHASGQFLYQGNPEYECPGWLEEAEVFYETG